MAEFTALEFSMHVSNGEIVGLEHVLGFVDYDWIQWSMRDLQASPKLGSGLNINELERRVADADGGLSLAHAELLEIARRLDQTIDVILLGYDASGSVGISGTPIIIIRAEDSTLWRIEYDSTRIEIVPPDWIGNYRHL